MDLKFCAKWIALSRFSDEILLLKVSHNKVLSESGCLNNLSLLRDILILFYQISNSRKNQFRTIESHTSSWENVNLVNDVSAPEPSCSTMDAKIPWEKKLNVGYRQGQDSSGNIIKRTSRTDVCLRRIFLENTNKSNWQKKRNN